MKPPYSFNPNQYDDDGSLRIGLLLWLTLLIINRHLLLLIIAAISAFVGAGRGLDTGALSMLYSSPVFLLASLLALPVLVAAIRRSPKAGRLPRHIWRHGRGLLLAATCSDLGLLAFGLLARHIAVDESHTLWGIIDAYMIAYLIRSRRVAAVFADFPEAPHTALKR